MTCIVTCWFEKKPCWLLFIQSQHMHPLFSYVVHVKVTCLTFWFECQDECSYKHSSKSASPDIDLNFLSVRGVVVSPVGTLLNKYSLSCSNFDSQLPQGATVVVFFKLWRQRKIAGELWRTCISFLRLKQKRATVWNVYKSGPWPGPVRKHRELQVGKTATQPLYHVMGVYWVIISL